MRWLSSFLLVAFLGIFPAQADTTETARSSVLDAMVSKFIVPGYAHAIGAANAHSAAMDVLCTEPNTENLASARASFKALVDAWSGVEIVRFGPVRTENRFERLFFWPDRRSRGLKQVQALVAKQQADALSSDDLRKKSVAVQGLLALEFVLHGTGSETLSEPESGRCGLGNTISHAIEITLTNVHEDWTKPGGYAETLQQPGVDNPIYRSQEEVLQEILRAASEQLQIVRNLKIGAVIGNDPAKAKPKRAPFWRSDLTLVSLDRNLESVGRLFSDTGFSELLTGEDVWLLQTLEFELKQAREVLENLRKAGTPWVAPSSSDALVKQTFAHQRLAYSQIPLAGAIRVISEAIPVALGLKLGFNSLDGD